MGIALLNFLKQNMVFWHDGIKYFSGGMGRQRYRRQCYGDISAVCFHPCGLCDNTENLNFGLHNEIERFSFLFFCANDRMLLTLRTLGEVKMAPSTTYLHKKSKLFILKRLTFSNFPNF